MSLATGSGAIMPRQPRNLANIGQITENIHNEMALVNAVSKETEDVKVYLSKEQAAWSHEDIEPRCCFGINWLRHRGLISEQARSDAFGQCLRVSRTSLAR
jgi:hypothetical protein